MDFRLLIELPTKRDKFISFVKANNCKVRYLKLLSKSRHYVINVIASWMAGWMKRIDGGW